MPIFSQNLPFLPSGSRSSLRILNVTHRGMAWVAGYIAR